MSKLAKAVTAFLRRPAMSSIRFLSTEVFRVAERLLSTT